jgi:hypothetical protein
MHKVVAAKMVIVGFFKVRTAAGRSGRSFFVDYLTYQFYVAKVKPGFPKNAQNQNFFFSARPQVQPAPAEL